jgi:dTDP-D-glucose 4,6-dehydratase
MRVARSILVAGAAGFIGSNFVRWWLERHRDDHVVALDRLTYAGDPRNLDGLGVRLAVADICDLEPTERILGEEHIDTVVNFAAESHDSLAVLDPGRFFRTNVTHALDDRELPLYVSTQNRREWLHVADHCRAIELVLERGREGETYNVGSGLERSIEEIAVLVLDLAGKPRSLKTIVPDRPGHDRRYLLDSGKLRRELGWEPEISFEDGLRATVEWYAANRSWWEPLRDRAPVPESQWS